MKALTICQPYASMIISGDKPVENRTWRPPVWLIGQRLAIHAGKSREWLSRWYGPLPDPMSFGAVIGTAVVDGWFHCHDVPDKYSHLRLNPHVCGPWCWVLRDPVAFPVPYVWTGRQGLWDWEVPE